MNIGLVLSGGMAKGAIQLGALKALRNFIPPHEIQYMSCASIGVLNGYAFAADLLERAEDMWINICENSSRMIISQILRSSLLQQNIQSIYDPSFRNLPTLYCALFDLAHRNLLYKDLSKVDIQDLPSYLKASVAMPIYNRAVPLGNASYFDGAMIDNIPVHPLLNHDLDYIICIYFDDTYYKFENNYFDSKVIKVVFPGKSILRQSVVFKKEQTIEMLQDGYDKSMLLFNTIFSKGYQDVSKIRSSIEILNRTTGSSGLRITGDVLVSNLNRITGKLMRKNIL